MPVEIERKFLVPSDKWRKPEPGQRYLQGYLCKGEVTVRVRCGACHGFLTIKGSRNGNVRPEFEYEIPRNEAEELLQLCHRPLIEKVRHEIWHAGMVWHVDEFAGENAGLVLAEVELRHPGQAVVLPEWVGEEVTSDERYHNSRLADAPQGNRFSSQPEHRPAWHERAGCAAASMRVLADVARTMTESTGQGEAGGALVRESGRTPKRKRVPHEAEDSLKERDEASGTDGQGPSPRRQAGEHVAQAGGQERSE